MINLLQEIITIILGAITILSAFGCILWILLVSNLKRKVLKPYSKTEWVASHFYNKDKMHDEFISREKFDDKIEPLRDRMISMESKMDSVIAKMDEAILFLRERKTGA